MCSHLMAEAMIAKRTQEKIPASAQPCLSGISSNRIVCRQYMPGPPGIYPNRVVSLSVIFLKSGCETRVYRMMCAGRPWSKLDTLTNS